MFDVELVRSEMDTLVLIDRDEGSRVELVPSRGGIVTRFALGGREVLYLDPGTLRDPTKNVRGGIPVLFPIAGRLANDAYRVDGTAYGMKQHGFARNLPWAVREQETSFRARVTLGLASTETTRAAFPWDFDARVSYALAGRTLAVEAELRNNSATPMPLHLGFHPYFRVTDARKSRASVSTDATRAWDNLRGAEVPFQGFDLARPEVDMHLLDQRARAVRLDCGDGTAVRIDMEPVFATLVVWTLGGKDFVCVEPWTAPADALNTGRDLPRVPPGESAFARWSITAE